MACSLEWLTLRSSCSWILHCRSRQEMRRKWRIWRKKWSGKWHKWWNGGHGNRGQKQNVGQGCRVRGLILTPLPLPWLLLSHRIRSRGRGRSRSSWKIGNIQSRWMPKTQSHCSSAWDLAVSILPGQAPNTVQMTVAWSWQLSKWTWGLSDKS